MEGNKGHTRHLNYMKYQLRTVLTTLNYLKQQLTRYSPLQYKTRGTAFLEVLRLYI